MRGVSTGDFSGQYFLPSFQPEALTKFILAQVITSHTPTTLLGAPQSHSWTENSPPTKSCPDTASCGQRPLTTVGIRREQLVQ